MGSDSSSKKILVKINEIAKDLCESEGLEFILAEFVTYGGQKVLRVYIEHENGIKIDDCVSISRELGNLLDVKLEIPGKYNLEVSSPGFDRPLVKPDDFRKFKGEKVYIKTISPLAPDSRRTNFKGVISETDDEAVIIEIEKKTYKIHFKKIKSARLNPDI
ncbi:MAG: ribosome maturation factor RimP [Deltaproteobacteria bacterium]|nr:MAG: ribosome maturation factor RimP [Deltaproteobacteria bacterium]